MRLLFLSNLYPPHEIGGYEQWCREVTVRLRRRGHTVHVLTSRHGNDVASPEEPDVTWALHLQAGVEHYRPLEFFTKRSQQEQENARLLRKAIDDTRPDLIVVWGMWNLSRNLPCWAEGWMPGQVAYYVSSYWPMDRDIHLEYWTLPGRTKVGAWLKGPLRSLALARLRKEGYPPRLRFERAVCCSHYVRDTLVEAGALPASAGVLFGGTDPAPFVRASSQGGDRAQSKLRLLYFGSLLPQKGVHTAVEALGLLEERGLGHRLELTLLGGGHPDYEARLHDLTEALGLGERVRFAGRVSRDEIPSWLGRFDVYLFTSIWAEPMARSVMEAMAAGLLVVGTEVGGQPEMLIDGQNGLTFQAGDADGLADCIVRALDDPSTRRRLAEAGREAVLERFTLERMVDDIEAWLAAVAP